MIYLFLILSLSLIFFLYLKMKKKHPKYIFLQQYKREKTLSLNVIDINSLLRSPFFLKKKQQFKININMVGEHPYIKLLIFYIVISILLFYLNSSFFDLSNLIFIPVCISLITFFIIYVLSERRKTRFNKEFPDVLNVLMSAISAGDSINQAFDYVGETIHNEIGKEFKDISKRMTLGESTDNIFERSSRLFPYPPFLFFVISIKANMSRGGQLKTLMSRLVRVLVEARSLEKKKLAMTSESRISAKIVGAIPICFIIFMYFFTPENLDFILFDPNGKWILYYVIINESLGMLIIWMLVRSIK